MSTRTAEQVLAGKEKEKIRKKRWAQSAKGKMFAADRRAREDKDWRRAYMKKYNQGYAAKDRADRARRRLTPDGWAKVVLPGIRARAKKRGLEFDLAPEDLRYPEYCPVLGIKLVPGRVEGFNACPSVDRFDNTKGYTKDNIRVISARANSLKKDASIQEMRAILAYMEGVS